MSSRFQNLRPGVLVLALAISVFIWAVAQGTSSVIQSFDVEVELVGVEEGLVITWLDLDLKTRMTKVTKDQQPPDLGGMAGGEAEGGRISSTKSVMLRLFRSFSLLALESCRTWSSLTTGSCARRSI